MTFSTGMRKRNVPQRTSTPQAQTQAQGGATLPVIPLTNGGTGKTTPLESRAALGVPGLASDNVFTGLNTFTNMNTFSSSASIVVNCNIDMDGAKTAALGSVEATYLDTSFVAAFAGGVMLKYVAKTADYTLTTSDCVVDVTSGSPTITLPTAVESSQGGTLSAGRVYIIKNSGAGTVTLATTSSQTIDGAAPGTVAAGGVIRLVSTGSNWVSV